jgi:membrane associated rhomboid family serine protease
MKDYLLTKRPRIAIYLILILFVSNIITLIFSEIGNIVMLYPSNLGEPWNWYKLITYPLYVGGLVTWFLNSLAILCYGYIIENRLKKTDLVGLILISSIVGGLFFIVFNQNSEFNVPIASPSMIAWGYWAATMVIGIKCWKSLNLFEKIIFILGFFSILSIWNDNFGFLLSQIIVIVLIMILTIIKTKK